ncbi:MAG: hypothetical protein MJ057_00095 [Sphaerochaetaceae bacterium]|nr:hypothetical protein [Sphaerochaetaceae bacterium]
MPNVQKKKLNKGSLIAFFFLALMIITVFVNLQFWLKLLIIVGLMGLFIFVRRAYMFFAMAATAMKKKDYDKAFRLLDKALKLGVDDERQVMAGSANIQQGDVNRGIEILEKVINKPKKSDYHETAIITLSMGYWMKGEVDKAVQILKDLRETGYRDDNLSINLETYMLYQGKLKEVKNIIKENRENSTENNGLLDNRGWYYIQVGEWDKAAQIYDELIDDRNAKFPEAYLHGAQVSIHNGDISQAIDRLGWGTSKHFSHTCLTTKAYLENLLLGLENPATREAFAKAMEENAVTVSVSKEFPGFEMACEFDEDAEDVIKPKKRTGDNRSASQIAADKARQAVKERLGESSSDDDGEILNTDVDDDDREPNTDLDDEDDAIAASFGQADEPEEEDDSPNTDVDDDEREPNTDLGDDE